MNQRLPDFWWLMPEHKWRRHAYTCPLLMTLSAWIHRVRGKPAYWEDSVPARVYSGNAEILCLFPRWLILRECDFWNGRIGLRIRVV